MRDFKYKTTFSSTVKTVYATQQGKYISEASLLELNSMMPEDSHIVNNYDLLYNAFNGAVINRVNKNDDGLDSETAVKIFHLFVDKPCNLEHSRDSVVGHIKSVGFSSYKTNKILSVEEAATTKAPYYLSMSAVVYKVVDPEFCDLLIEASDETSASYNSISTSWELGFDDYYIALNHRDLDQAELIKDPEKIQLYNEYLKVYGGSGKLPDGTPVYRVICGDPLPLGIGYTMNPAADVLGVMVSNLNTELNLAQAKDSEAILEIPKEENIELNQDNQVKSNEKNNIISQQNNATVKTNRTMKINKLSDLTEDSLKEVSVANLTAFLADEIDKASTQYAEQLEAKNKKIKEDEEQAEKAKASFDDVKNAFEALKLELETEKAARAQEKAQADFSFRMSDLESKFDLTEKDQELIAKQIRSLDEAGFTEWLSDFEVLAEQKKKGFKPFPKKDDKEKDKNMPACASNASVESVLDNATVVAQANIPNVISPEVSLANKWAEAFKIEDLVVGYVKPKLED